MLALSLLLSLQGIDISVGAVMTFSSVASGVALTRWGFPSAAILFGILVGGFCGAVSGIGVTKMFLPPFIATMAMQMITKGLSLVVSNMRPIYFTSEPVYQRIATGSFLGISGFHNAIVILIAVTIIAYILFSKTLIGRYSLAIGSNEEAARLSGVNVDRWKIRIYALGGLFAGVGGLIMSSRLGSAQPQLGVGYELGGYRRSSHRGSSLSGGEGAYLEPSSAPSSSVP